MANKAQLQRKHSRGGVIFSTGVSFTTISFAPDRWALWPIHGWGSLVFPWWRIIVWLIVVSPVAFPQRGCLLFRGGFLARFVSLWSFALFSFALRPLKSTVSLGGPFTKILTRNALFKGRRVHVWLETPMWHYRCQRIFLQIFKHFIGQGKEPNIKRQDWNQIRMWYVGNVIRLLVMRSQGCGWIADGIFARPVIILIYYVPEFAKPSENLYESIVHVINGYK